MYLSYHWNIIGVGHIIFGCPFHENNFWLQNGIEAGTHANYVTIYVVKPKGMMPSLKMSLGLIIRPKVSWAQNNKKIDIPSFLCHLLT